MGNKPHHQSVDSRSPAPIRNGDDQEDGHINHNKQSKLSSNEELNVKKKNSKSVFAKFSQVIKDQGTNILAPKSSNVKQFKVSTQLYSSQLAIE